MSISVTYYSFSPSRADLKWQQEGAGAVENILRTISGTHLTWEEISDINKRTEMQFGTKFSELRQEVVKKFKGTSLDYEWEEWDEVIDFMSEKERKSLTELNELAEAFKENERKKILAKKVKPKINKQDFLFEILSTDLEFGGVSTQDGEEGLFAEEPWVENYCLGALAMIFGFSTTNTVPTREEWINLYKDMNTALFVKAVELIADKTNTSKNVANVFLVNYLKEVKPIVKDLAEQTDSIFYADYGGSSDSEPKEVVELLNERAESLYLKYKHLVT